MKLKVVLLFVLALFSLSAFCQFKLGVRAGLTSSSIKASDITAGNVQVSTLSNAKLGFQGGLILQIAVAGMYLQPEMLLSSTGGQVQVKDVNSTVVMNQRFTKLDIPVIIGEKIGPLRLGLGPVASIVLNKPNDAINFSSTSVESKYHHATFGYQFDVGLDIWKLAFDVKYEGNLSYLGNGINVGGTNYKFDSRNHQFIFGVALFL